MADSRAMWFRLSFLISLLAGSTPAVAQTWQACVDPASGGLTADGYSAVREAAVESRGEPRRFLAYRLRRMTQSGLHPAPPFRTVQLEMMYAGIGAGSISWEDATPYLGLPFAEQSCFEITAEEGAPGLWHYWGPYFTLGSAVVPEAARSGLEYLVPGYQPGRSLFIVSAYADTAGSPEQNERLSAARAEAVAVELVRLGIRWEDIEQRSFGESHLARPTADGVAEQLNRRAFVDVRQRPLAPR